MKVFRLTLGLALAFQASLMAGQIAGGAPALGGSFASRGMARPLGGISPGYSRGNYRGAAGSRYAAPILPYAYSWYVPNYFDWDSGNYSTPYPPPPVVAPPAPVQPPVVINQFFGGPPPQQAQTDAPQVAPGGDNASVKPGNPIGPVDNYYLIAYKNHQVYAALAYWVEDNTLHYVTTENTHNQASLSLIDLDLTRTLNQARNVPFSVQPR